MKKTIYTILLFSSVSFLTAQNNESIITQIGDDQYAGVEQLGIENHVLIEQVSTTGQQSAWIFQSGTLPGGELNNAQVDQTHNGNGNRSFLYQFGSFNKSFQSQKGNNNTFNMAGNFPEPISGIASLPVDAVPNQDGDYHELSQMVNGNSNQAWIYQAGRKSTGSQDVMGDQNEFWTSQSGYQQNSEMIIRGNRNGSHYLQHGEGKFPHEEEEEESSGAQPGGQGNGNSSSSGGHSDEGGMPEVIPPPHDEEHVFVPTVGVAIKQMGSNSIAEMYIEGDDNKAVIIQRGGAGSPGFDETSANGSDCEGGHYVDQDIYGDWNRIFADQRGTGHTMDQYISGNQNLVTFMQKGNGSLSDIILTGNSNEIGVDQKGKGNISHMDISGDYNGNFTPGVDEYGIKLVQEGKENYSDVDILGDYNYIAVHQGGGAISIINQNGNWNSVIVNQSTIDDH